MRVIQVVWSLEFGDGVSNCIFSISKVLDEFNYSNSIVSFYVDDRVKGENVRKLDNIYDSIVEDSSDIVIYHFSIGCPLNYIVENMQCKKILVYQNVTKPDFYRGVDDEVLKLCLWGLYDAAKTTGRYLKSIVMSEFNKNDLLKMGWKTEDVLIFPLVKTENVFSKKNQDLFDRLKGGFVNILFTGRIVPNKKIEDIIKIFSYYQKNVNCKSRLILVGGIRYQNYYNALVDYIQLLGCKNVMFTGHVANDDLEAYYAAADVFLCMSEHEGFCIPLVEAMKREIPIIAYSAAAVPDTLGESGVLVDTKDEKKVAGILNRIATDCEYRNKVIYSQKRRLSSLSIENFKTKIKGVIDEIDHLESYSYTYEPKAISIYYPDRVNQCQSDELSDQLRKLLCEKDNIVIYGMGKAGKRILGIYKKFDSELLEKIVICDNSILEESYEDIPIFCHKECVKRYSKALYIITVQNSCVDIIIGLINDHVERENIKFFNLSSNKLI